MKLSQVAAQLFTVREFLKTPDDIAASLKKVRALGYTAVQVSGMGPIPEGDLKRLCEGEGLTICATHEKGGMIFDETQRVIDRLGALGCTQTAYPHPHLPYATLDEVRVIALGLQKAGERLAAAGITLSYHNHANEFRKVGGRTILELFMAETDPRHVQAEIDTYWVQMGGGDPVQWCARLKNRLPLLHMKDFAIGIDNKPVMAEIGAGNLDFRAIVAAADASGCKWFIVEQDICPGDPFDSLRQSFDHIKATLVQK